MQDIPLVIQGRTRGRVYTPRQKRIDVKYKAMMRLLVFLKLLRVFGHSQIAGVKNFIGGPNHFSRVSIHKFQPPADGERRGGAEDGQFAK